MMLRVPWFFFRFGGGGANVAAMGAPPAGGSEGVPMGLLLVLTYES